MLVSRSKPSASLDSHGFNSCKAWAFYSNQPSILFSTDISIATVGVGLSTSEVDMATIAHNDELAFMMTAWNRMEITPLMDANLVACEILEVF